MNVEREGGVGGGRGAMGLGGREKGRGIGKGGKGAPVKNRRCKFLIGCAEMSNLFTFIK